MPDAAGSGRKKGHRQGYVVDVVNRLTPDVFNDDRRLGTDRHKPKEHRAGKVGNHASAFALDRADQKARDHAGHDQEGRKLHKARAVGDRHQPLEQIPNLIAVPIGVKDKRVVHHLNSLALSGHASIVGVTWLTARLFSMCSSWRIKFEARAMP